MKTAFNLSSVFTFIYSNYRSNEPQGKVLEALLCKAFKTFPWFGFERKAL